ncbi:MAG: glycosyltransferase family 4 protein [Sphingobium sp.]
MRILALTRYSRLGASSRLRTLQYLPYLAQSGFDITVAPFFDNGYLQRLYGRQSQRSQYPRFFRERIATLRAASGHDAIWIEKEALPWLPWAVERRLLPRNVPIVVDYDDAIFHRYDRHRSGLVRSLLGDKIDAVMAHADLVIAGNAYLRDRAVQAGAKRTEIVPTVVDIDRYDLATARPEGRPRIGWIGSPSTAPYLQTIMPAVERVARDCPADWIAIGARDDQLAAPFTSLRWSEDEEVSLLRTLDIGIMPLPDDDWSRGKCGYKLIQYMACGLPVIASPIGANCEIVTAGVNGFLADGQEEWANALRQLIDDGAMRAEMGAAGRAIVERQYSLQSQAPRLAALLRSVAGA